jgi:hypothetical protein
MYQGFTNDLTIVIDMATAILGWPSLCTIQARPGDPNQQLDSRGWPNMVIANYTNRAGLINIPCRIAVQAKFKPDMGGVRRTSEGFDQIIERHLLLNGYYTGIFMKDLAIVDTVAYEIMAVETDSQLQVMTRLAIRQFLK